MIARLLISKSYKIRGEEIEKILSSEGLKNPDPDLLYFSAPSKLGIEQARKIKEHFSLKPYTANGRAVVLEDASKLTVEAQNALLKILEEPPKGAIIILAASSDTKLLPTVLSRCQIIHLPQTNLVGSTQTTYEVYTKDLEKLVNSSIEQRFEYIEKLKDREEFLTFLVAFFRKELLDPKITKRWTAVHPFMTELLQAEEWAEANVNIRAILEYLILKMPTKI